MSNAPHLDRPRAVARLAGVLYLVIIVCGLASELLIRGRLVDPGDAARTAGNLIASEGLFRAGFLADATMIVADVALAVLLYALFRPVGRTWSLVAMAFRLLQAGVLAVNLLHHHAAILILTGERHTTTFAPETRAALASFWLDLHAHGYDLGLVAFGVHCLLLGRLIARSTYVPRWIGVLVMAAGPVYLLGSGVRFLAPQHLSAIQPIYVIAVAAELALCVWLLTRGVRVEAWERRVTSVR